MKRIIFATHNKHKKDEVKSILLNIGRQIVTLEDIGWNNEIVEDGNTFQENAKKKINALLLEYPNDFLLADDSGLVVDSLNGEPGVMSARYAGENSTSEQLCTKLLSAMSKVEEPRRNAFFITVLAFYNPLVKNISFFEGRVDGYITKEMIGKNGFGYDPVFFVSSKNKTLAEMDFREKNSLSHRYKALQQFKFYLKKQ
jgi:XTP/dITP diphosphohydrolase